MSKSLFQWNFGLTSAFPVAQKSSTPIYPCWDFTAIFACLNRFRKHENGIAAVELGLATPVFLLMFLSVTELGHMIYYSITIEKGIRSGITYMARNSQAALDDPDKRLVIDGNAINLTMRGSMDPDAPFLVKGYKKATENFLEPVSVNTRPFVHDFGGTIGSVTVTIIVVKVDVPYVPLLPFITDSLMGTFNPSIKLTHEQALIGD